MMQTRTGSRGRSALVLGLVVLAVFGLAGSAAVLDFSDRWTDEDVHDVTVF